MGGERASHFSSMAAFPIALTEGFDEPGRVMDPAFFGINSFGWGFLLFSVYICLESFSVILTISLPRIGIYDGYLTKEVPIARNFPSFYLRILPPVLGLTYMCKSWTSSSVFWAFRLIAIVKEGVMARTGFNVGISGLIQAEDDLHDSDFRISWRLLFFWRCAAV